MTVNVYQNLSKIRTFAIERTDDSYTIQTQDNFGNRIGEVMKFDTFEQAEKYMVTYLLMER